MNDFGMYSDEEVLEIVRDIARKVWNTCIIVSLMDLGRIGRATAITQYGLGAENLYRIHKRYKKAQREMVRNFSAGQPKPQKINAQLEFFLGDPP